MPDVAVIVSGTDSVQVQTSEEVIEVSSVVEVVQVQTVVEVVEVNVGAGSPITVETTPEVVEVSVPTTPTIQILVGSGGSGSGAIDDTHLAISALSGHRVVFFDTTAGSWVYADKGTPAHAGAQLGVLLGSIGAGQYGAARLSGTIEEPSWSWPAPCVLYLGINGAITSVPPTTGFSAEIGRAITPTKIMVEPEMAIHLLPGV